ncbi:hypothetical protein [Streptomyces sp. NPDC088725]|uniref:hypothetical protein n=1 Tax=Streptomyces sp. NPDC088725 TaxID=3365873 RepID=UPI00381AB883
MYDTSLTAGWPEEESREDALRAGGREARPRLWSAVVAIGFTLAQLAFVVPGMGLGWDETVYVSQVSPHAPAAFFSAPRARGISLLVAPVTGLTDSVTVLRCYLAVATGGALYAGLWVWRRLLPGPVVALAGALFATLWITLFYGPQVMPNLAVALSALIATGCFLRAVREDANGRTGTGSLTGMGCALAVAGLMRPTDALWLALPLAVAACAVRSWRRPVVLLVLAAGVALGAAQWVVEAYTAYGGLGARLHRASEIQGGMGWHLAFGDQLRGLEGRSLCRPCDMPWRRPWSALWWFALPLLAAGGVFTAMRTRLRAVVIVPALTGLSLAVPYLLMIDYAAPRFLLATYALLLLPAAVCLHHLVTAASPALRRPVVPAVALLLLLHVGSQYVILHSLAERSRASRGSVGRIATELHRLGVRPPCTVTGIEAVRIGFSAGCASRQIAGHDASISRAALLALAQRQPVAVLVPLGHRAPAYAHTWRSTPFPQVTGLPGFRAYVSPSARPRTGGAR